jgi:hypothetical protein
MVTHMTAWQAILCYDHQRIVGGVMLLTEIVIQVSCKEMKESGFGEHVSSLFRTVSDYLDYKMTSLYNTSICVK